MTGRVVWRSPNTVDTNIINCCQRSFAVIYRVACDTDNIQSHLDNFYSASSLLAMQSAVLARGILFVCLSVCPSRSGIVSRRIKITIVRFSASGRTIPLVSGEVKFIRIFVGDHPQWGIKVRHPSIDSENSTNNWP